VDLRENLLGVILERSGVLSREQVESVRAEQARVRAAGKAVAFGQVALARKLVTEAQLRKALQQQQKISWPMGTPVPLGAQLLAVGLVKPDALVAALEEQVQSKALIGQLLIKRGAVKPEVLAHYLETRLTPR
jgi:hypothetical protein